MSSSSSSHGPSSLLKPPPYQTPYKKPKPSSSSSFSSDSSLPSPKSTKTPSSEPINGGEDHQMHDPFVGLFENLPMKEKSTSFMEWFTPPILPPPSNNSLQKTNKNTKNSTTTTTADSQDQKEKKCQNGRSSTSTSWCVKAGAACNPFPPPIPCLKEVKHGQPFAYKRFTEGDPSFVVEEVKIPIRDLLRACRSHGSLKLCLVLSSDDDDDDDCGGGADHDEVSQMEEEYCCHKAESQDSDAY